MDTKTIKISADNYKWLVKVAGELQQETGKTISIDAALKTLRQKKISDLGGSWQMKDKEYNTIKKELRKRWAWKIESL